MKTKEEKQAAVRKMVLDSAPSKRQVVMGFWNSLVDKYGSRFSVPESITFWEALYSFDPRIVMRWISNGPGEEILDAVIKTTGVSFIFDSDAKRESWDTEFPPVEIAELFYDSQED